MKTSIIIRRLAAVLSAVSLCVTLALPAQADNCTTTYALTNSSVSRSDNVVIAQSMTVKKNLVGKKKIYTNSSKLVGNIIYINPSKTVYADLTGDNVNDEIKIEIENCGDSSDSDSTIQLIISVNGKKARTLNLVAWPVGDSDLTIYYLRQSKNKEFLYINSYSMGYFTYVSRVYQYDNETGKLKCVLNLDKCPEGKYKHVSFEDKSEISSVTKNKITFTFRAEPPQVGSISYSYSYILKNGRLKRSPKQAKVTANLFENNKLVTSKKLKLYKAPGSKKIAVTVKKGEAVKMKKITYKNGKTYAKFSCGKKSGWVEIGYGNWSGKDWFDEVYLDMD